MFVVVVQFVLGFGQFQQIVDCGQQFVVVLWFGQVVGCVGFDQVYCIVEVCLGSEQDYWQIWMVGVYLFEQCFVFFIGGGVFGEVYVLDYQVDWLLFQQG